MEQEKLIVDRSGNQERLDIYLAHKLADRISRSQLKKNIESGLVRVDGQVVTPHFKLKTGASVEIEWVEKPMEGVRAEDIPIDILHEDEDILVVNKPAGMVVHPAYANPDHTLVNALLYHFKILSGMETIRPGIVHRLDKDTSGVMVVAKNDRTHAILANQFKNHTIEKIYDALVRGVIQHDEGMCEEPVARAFLNRKKVMVKPAGGKTAETFFRVQERFKQGTWVKVFPKTGRTHQIRVHLNHLGYPIWGDALYGVTTPWISRQALHAYALSFDHPKTRKRMCFEAPLPQDMRSLIEQLKVSGGGL